MINVITLFVKRATDIFQDEGMVIWLNHVCLQPLGMKWDFQESDIRGAAW